MPSFFFGVIGGLVAESATSLDARDERRFLPDVVSVGEAELFAGDLVGGDVLFDLAVLVAGEGVVALL